MGRAATVVEVDASAGPANLREYGEKAIRMRLSRLLEQVSGVRRGEDIEAVHQMRVWSRRSRAALTIFAAVFPGKEYRAIQREVRGVTRALGAARDMDVMAVHLKRLQASLSSEQAGGLAAFIAGLQQKRRRAQAEVLAVLSRLGRFDLLGRLGAVSCDRESTGSDPVAAAGIDECEAEPVFMAAGRVIDHGLRDVLQYEQFVARPDRVLELHAMRVAAKRLRYAMEVFEPAYAAYPEWGSPFSSALGEIRALQEMLGAIHDADVLVPALTAEIDRRLGTPRDHDAVARQPDFDACLGLIAVCKEIGRDRERKHGELVTHWRGLRAARTFETLRGVLRAAAASSLLRHDPQSTSF